jgi:glutamate formiminotransferase/glutamate formiminotransferase/formiminotetrahydrofolate cyclodeaminase
VLPLESVPNLSEGRDERVIAELGAAFGQGARLLDVHSDPDHHRSVFTLVGGDDALVDSLVSGIARACELIDLRVHDGVHPRVGAADVVPLVPLRSPDMPRARAAALTLAERVGAELALPVFLYGEVGDGRRPAFFRRGGPDELQRRVDTGELAPAFGPSQLDPAVGAVLIGARRPLIAFNVDLRTDDVEVAREIAAAVREAGGGFAGVRALGLRLPRSGRVQVSMNVEDWEATGLHEIVVRIEELAGARGVAVAGSELVGLMPAGAAAAAAGASLRIEGFDARDVLELRLLDPVEEP